MTAAVTDAQARAASSMAIRLQGQFGSVHNAKLPELYAQARDGLAQCLRTDECKAWADKAEAIRAYARMAGDDALVTHAMKIKNRAVTRMGELIDEVEKQQGGDRRSKGGLSDPLITPRQLAIQSAGISTHQAKQAQAIARFKRNEPERYEAMVERAKPATVTQLAKEGRKPAPPPKTDHLKGFSAKDFSLATYAIGETGRMVESVQRIAPRTVAILALPTQRAELQRSARVIGKWLAELTKHIRRVSK